MRKKKTHEEYVEELKIKNPNIIPLEEYKGANTPILHKCLVDEYEWLARPGNMLFGCGCPKCSQRFRRTNKDYLEEISLKNPNIESLEEFKGMKPEDIVSLIEGEPIIGGVPVDGGLTNIRTDDLKKNGDRIVGLNTENSDINEGVVRYDILFYVRMRDGLSRIIVNVEA